MQNVPQRPTKIQHYASYLIGGEEVFGIARLVGGGYYFTPDVGESRLVSYKDVDLLLYGQVDISHQQWVLDEAQGGLVATCSRTMRS